MQPFFFFLSILQLQTKENRLVFVGILSVPYQNSYWALLKFKQIKYFFLFCLSIGYLYERTSHSQTTVFRQVSCIFRNAFQSLLNLRFSSSKCEEIRGYHTFLIIVLVLKFEFTTWFSEFKYSSRKVIQKVNTKIVMSE